MPVDEGAVLTVMIIFDPILDTVTLPAPFFVVIELDPNSVTASESL